MSSQIDPLTGLPMVFDNIIEQIPLDAQIFPYADLGATARPTAPPLYPDSIIPVSAFLSGQHPDTGSAQTVATNGDHDLRVHVTNPAPSGGSTPLPADAFQLNNLFANTGSSGNITISDTFHLSHKLYGFSLGFMYMAAPPVDVSPLQIWIEDETTFDDIMIWSGYPRKLSGGSFIAEAVNMTYFYPTPIDLTTFTNGDLHNFELDLTPDNTWAMILKLFAD